ncbi:PLP-dependent aminotransferase family protein [Taklimakanibacter deserti]|uniref:MocR-like ectoine utilization transcription factor EhuR n=1 Tax=Taklimakanibacter deserti TaxID=2267839 RepID=UPI0013C4F996
MWVPDYKTRPGRIYVALADAMADDIASGRLRPGERLPTHRELAWHLQLSVSTVSKAYALAARRHLIGGEVGRGTFVTSRPSDLSRLEPNRAQSDLIDLTFNCPVQLPVQEKALASTLRDIADSERLPLLMPYHRDWIGMPEHRHAASAWLEKRGAEATQDDIVIVNGGQQAVSVILAALLEPGEIMAAEELTDPGIKFLAANRHLTLKGLPIDEHGLIPEAFDAACRGGPLRALICCPNHQSPTLAVMPVERRQAIAEIAVKHDVILIEDDVYGGFIETALPSISSFAPEHSYYATSLSKIVCPGLRIGYIATPPGRARDLIPGLGATTWMAASLSAEIAYRWIEDGTADRLAQVQRDELRKRQALAGEILAGQSFRSLPTGLHLWLDLPEAWRAESFVAQLRAQGAAVTPAEAFAVGHGPSRHAIRVSLGGATPSRTELQKGLEILADLLRGRPAASYVVL